MVGGGAGGGAHGTWAQRWGRVRGGGPRSGAERQAAAEPSAAGVGTATSWPAMSSGTEPQTPRTPFSIADILSPRMVPGGPSVAQLTASSPGPTSPLCALEELTNKTFHGLDGHAPKPSEGIALPRSRTVAWPSPHLSPPGSWSLTFVHPGRHPNLPPPLSPPAGICISRSSPPLC